MYQPQPNYMPTAVIHERRPINWRLIGAYALGFLGAAIGIACILLLVSYKNAVATQMSQMSQAIQREHSANASNYSNLNDKFAGMAGIESAVASYSMTCSQYLTGPNGGPTTFYFPCSDVKPGG